MKQKSGSALLKQCLLITGFFILTGLRLEASEQLRVLSWGGAYQQAQREAIFAPYEYKTGVHVEEHTYKGNIDEIKAALNPAGYDVVQVEAPDLLLGCKHGYFEKLNWDKLGSRFQYVPGAAEQCGVGAITWSMVLAYNDANFKKPLKSADWKSFFDLVNFPGKRALRRTPQFTLELALLADGVLPSQVYPLLETQIGLKRSLDKLSVLFPFVKWWESGDDPLLWLDQGLVDMAAVYNGRIQQYQRAHHPSFLSFSWQQQIIAMDYWAILKTSPQIKRAYTFLQFATHPKLLKDLMMKIPYGPVHKQTFQMLKAKDHLDLLSSPWNMNKAFMLNPGFWVKNGPRLKTAFYEWFQKQSLQFPVIDPLARGVIEIHPLNSY
jgi:putative spermidine/putrescine transport system substrate-binding protein